MRWTFPDLCPICSSLVTTLWLKLSAVANSAFLPTRVVNKHAVVVSMQSHELWGWSPLNGRLWLHVALWLQAKVCDDKLGLWPRVYTSSGCRTACCSCSVWLVALCSAMPLPFNISRLRLKPFYAVLNRSVGFTNSQCVLYTCLLLLKMSLI